MTTRTSALALPVLLTIASFAPAQQVRGIISSVEPAKKQLVIEGLSLGVRGMSLKFTLDDKALQVWFGREAGKVEELVAGQRVVVTYETKADRRVATAVYVRSLRPAQRQPAPAADAPKARKAPDEEQVAGLLRRVDRTEREIVVAVQAANGQEKYVTLPVPEDAEVTRDSKPIKFDDLKEEEDVVAGVETRNGKRVAAAIAVGKHAAIAAKPAPAMNKEQPSKIARLRQVLKVVDAILEEVDQRMNRKR
jgi:hypothetical protein